jgi:hypothetical protein
VFDNDRLSHWFAGALFSWVMMFLLFGIPIFHLWLRVPVATIATFIGICCLLQLAITPWLFSARVTRLNPSGRVAQRGMAVTVLSSMIALLFFYYLWRGWPQDTETRQFTAIAVGGTILFAIFKLVRYCGFSRRHTDQSRSTPGKSGNR